MSGKYRYDHHKVRKHHYILIAVAVCLLLAGGGAFLIYLDMKNNSSGEAQGTSRVVGQVIGDSAAKKSVDEPFYTLQLPADWKEFERKDTPTEKSVTWTTTKKNVAGRTLKIYVDILPTTLPVNRMLPVTANGAGVTTGEVSENCATFTQGGTLDAQKAQLLKPTQARWQGVDFICNLPAVIDNQVGTSSHDGVNQVTVTGPQKGAHEYFFLYTEHNIQPDYTIFFDALASFQAK